MKKIIGLIFIIALCVGGYLYWEQTPESEAEEPQGKVVVVERGAIVEQVNSDGKVVSNLDVEIKCKASGEIVSLPFEVSQSITKGQLLAELDPVDERRSVRQAKAALQSAQARLRSATESLSFDKSNLSSDKDRAKTALTAAQAKAADAKAKAKRLEELLESKLASREEFETSRTLAVEAETTLKNAQIQLIELEAQERVLEVKRQEILIAKSEMEIKRIALEVAEQRLADTRVVSPMDGVVTTRDVQVGQIISSPISNVGGGTTLMTISDLSRIFVLASVDEADIGKVQLGQTTSITVDAYPRKRFKGEVVQISPRGVNVSNVVTFEVKIEVTSEDKALLLPEMTATIEITISKSEDTLLVPDTAIYRKQGKSFILVVGDTGEEAEREVTVGISNGNMAEIKEGLGEGESVYVPEGAGESRWRPSAARMITRGRSR